MLQKAVSRFELTNKNVAPSFNNNAGLDGLQTVQGAQLRDNKQNLVVLLLSPTDSFWRKDAQ